MDSSGDESIINDCMDDTLELNITKNKGKYEGSLSVDSNLFGFVIGKNKSNVKKIVENTQTSLRFVEKDSKIIVIGCSSESVKKALKEIYSRLDIFNTYFVSVHIKDKAIHERFFMFKERVLTSNKRSRIKDVGFRKPHQLHIAFTKIRLESKERVKRCIDKINDFKKENKSLFKPFKIHFKDIGWSEKDHTAVKRIFTKPVEDKDFERLSKFGRKINDYLFKEKIIPVSGEYTMNFHLMLINRDYQKYDFPQIKDFDITYLSDELKKWDFGIINVSEFCLLQKYIEDKSNSYKNNATWSLNEL